MKPIRRAKIRNMIRRAKSRLNHKHAMIKISTHPFENVSDIEEYLDYALTTIDDGYIGGTVVVQEDLPFAQQFLIRFHSYNDDFPSQVHGKSEIGTLHLKLGYIDISYNIGGEGTGKAEKFIYEGLLWHDPIPEGSENAERELGWIRNYLLPKAGISDGSSYELYNGLNYTIEVDSIKRRSYGKGASFWVNFSFILPEDGNMTIIDYLEENNVKDMGTIYYRRIEIEGAWEPDDEAYLTHIESEHDQYEANISLSFESKFWKKYAIGL